MCRASADPDVAPGQEPDDRYSQSIELSWEELKHVIEHYGFVFENEEDKECTYTRTMNSMLWSIYRAKFFTVRKPKTV